MGVSNWEITGLILKVMKTSGMDGAGQFSGGSTSHFQARCSGPRKGPTSGAMEAEPSRLPAGKRQCSLSVGLKGYSMKPSLVLTIGPLNRTLRSEERRVGK